MTEKEICEMVELQLGKRNVRPSDRLLEDLGAESADVANLIARVEERYGIFIKESEIAKVHTPADLFEIIQQKLNEA